MTLRDRIHTKIKHSFGKKKDHITREGLLLLLSGCGIEIGALQNPCTAPHLSIQYVDRFSKVDLLKQYPELASVKLTDPDIIDDAESLDRINNDAMDFVIANHVIEHMANPIKALLSWQRVLKPGGRLFLAVPEKNLTFDKERSGTTIKHLLEDFEAPSREADFEHYKEFALFVSCRTFNVRDETEYIELAHELFSMDYSIHYHVWDHSSFLEFIKHLENNFTNWQMRLVGESFQNENEFILVLEKREIYR